MDYSALHDATLQAVQLQWTEGVVRVSLIYFDGDRRRHGSILGTNVSDLSCPRAFPWGRSHSINTVSLDESETAARLLVEMQSGDQIVIVADAFSFEEGDVIPKVIITPLRTSTARPAPGDAASAASWIRRRRRSSSPKRTATCTR